MPISIYPPILLSTLSAFLYTTPQYDVNFSLLNVTSYSDIGHIQIRVVNQSNNRSIVNTAIYPDGTIYKPESEITLTRNGYLIPILISELAEPWQPGFLYKIQMRFGTTPIFSDISSFADWKKELINKLTFSEWSTVMVVKSISAPTTTIKNAEAVKADIISAERTEPTLTPLFVASTIFTSINKELVDKYRFNLYSGKGVDLLLLLETSDWLLHDSNVDSVDKYRFKTVLKNNQFYTVTYETVSVNGYESTADPYVFLASRAYYANLKNVSLKVDDDSTFCRENGCLRILLSALDELSGSFVLTRSNENTNYEVWEDLQYFIFSKLQFNETLIYEDFTIESGIKYKYAILQENAAGLRTSPVYDNTNAYHYIDFLYSYLLRNGVLLKLLFNNKMSTFKHTVLSSKQDTLGGKYPHILKNGYAYYAEFPVTGLISFLMDEDQTFFTLGTDGFYYNNELVIPRDKFREWDEIRGVCASGMSTNDTGIITNYNHLTIDSNLTDDNRFIERKFREKAEEFLNDYNYKLFRSATEGNIVVVLTNVSMLPNETLGRMIYSFTATAYEVLENTLENLNEYNIINIGHFDTLSSDTIHLSFGLIAGLYYTGDKSLNIYDLIKQLEEINLGDEYKAKLERVRSFWIERYPKTNFSVELNLLNVERAQRLEDGLDVEDIDKKIEELENLQLALLTPDYTNTILRVNNANILVRPNKIYSLREPVTTLSLVSSPFPIIINYVCELTQLQDLSVGIVAAIDTSRIWGLISGVFTGTDKILRNYNYDYKPGEPPLRVYNNRPDATVEYDKWGNVLVDNTNFNVYKTINLLDVIKEETRKLVEDIYNIEGGFKQNSKGEWTDGVIYYEFSDVILFDIEADPGTSLLISKYEDGSNPKKIIIGPTARYILNPADTLIRYVALEPTTYEELIPIEDSIISKYKIPSKVTNNTFSIDISGITSAGFMPQRILFKYGDLVVNTLICNANSIGDRLYISLLLYEYKYPLSINNLSLIGVDIVLPQGVFSYKRNVYKRLAPRFCLINYKCLTNLMKMLERKDDNARLFK